MAIKVQLVTPNHAALVTCSASIIETASTTTSKQYTLHIRGSNHFKSPKRRFTCCDSRSAFSDLCHDNCSVFHRTLIAYHDRIYLSNNMARNPEKVNDNIMEITDVRMNEDNEE
eukprot:846433_1